MDIWNSWKYKNITVVLLGVIFAFFLFQIEIFRNSLLHLGGLGYIGSFFAGILFVSTFTVATGVLILSLLVQSLHPIEIGLIAGLGAVVGDLIIFRFVKDGLKEEIVEVYDQFDKKHNIQKIFHSKYFNWMLPVMGALIIASPFPDELGVSLMGISKISTFRFILISYFLNSVGIFLVVSASLLI